MREENGVLKITLPCLLPKRKKQESTKFITAPLYFTLIRFSERLTEHEKRRKPFKTKVYGEIFGAPKGIRIPDLPLRRRTLYPAELPAHMHRRNGARLIISYYSKKSSFLKTERQVLRY